MAWFRQASAAAQKLGWTEIPETPQPEDDFTRQRKQIETFSEDYMPLGKRVLHGLARFVGYGLPFLAVIAVGSDLGQFYSPGLGAFSSYTLAYGIELAIAALTIMLGSAAASKEQSNSHYVKLALTFLAWIVLSTGSALSLFVMAIHSVMNITGNLFYVTVAWRVASVACFDAASVCILFWTGRSLANYLDELSKKMHAITLSAEAELGIQRAKQAARLREQEDAAYMRSRESHEAFTRQLQEIANKAILNSAQANLSITAIREEAQTGPLPLVGHSQTQMQNSGSMPKRAAARKGPKVEEVESTQTKK